MVSLAALETRSNGGKSNKNNKNKLILQ